MSTKDTCEALCQGWIDIYLNLLDIVIHDTNTDFDSMKFFAGAKILGIICHQISVEAH